MSSGDPRPRRVTQCHLRWTRWAGGPHPHITAGLASPGPRPCSLAPRPPHSPAPQAHSGQWVSVGRGVGGLRCRGPAGGVRGTGPGRLGEEGTCPTTPVWGHTPALHAGPRLPGPCPARSLCWRLYQLPVPSLPGPGLSPGRPHPRCDCGHNTLCMPTAWVHTEEVQP